MEVASDPVRFYIPPYVGKSGWVGMRLDAKTDWKLLEGLVAEAHREAFSRQSAARIRRGPDAAPKARPRPRPRRKRG